MTENDNYQLKQTVTDMSASDTNYNDWQITSASYEKQPQSHLLGVEYRVIIKYTSKLLIVSCKKLVFE